MEHKRSEPENVFLVSSEELEKLVDDYFDLPICKECEETLDSLERASGLCESCYRQHGG